MHCPRRIAAAALMIVTLGTGCATKKDSGPISGLSSAEAQSLNAQHSRFESEQDPAITAGTHYAAGRLAEAQGNSPAALRQYQQAQTVDPGHLPSLYRLGVVYAQQKDFARAIAAWQAYVKRTDGDATALANLGFCHELAGQVEQAEAAYRQGIAKDPRNNPCRVNYGLMLARQNRANEALIQLQAVLTEAQAHYNLASLYEQLGQKDKARGEYRRALELDPALAEARMRLSALD